MFTLMVSGVNAPASIWWNGSTTTTNGVTADNPDGSVSGSTQDTPSGTNAWGVPTTEPWLPTDTTFPCLLVGGYNETYFGNLNYPTGCSCSMLGNIDEMLVFNRALSSDERNSVETYLSMKYNLQTSEYPSGLPDGQAAASGAGSGS
jgi:hypothetical protein